MSRVYAADGHLVHDPATGLTHHASEPLPAGRLRLEQTEMSSWPVVAPSDLDRTMPASLCWSPIVRCNLHCPQCLDDTTVAELDAAARGRTAVSVTTNGWHLARRAEELAGAVDAIRVSLDGPDEASHDRIRGAGSFARAHDGICPSARAGACTTRCSPTRPQPGCWPGCRSPKGYGSCCVPAHPPAVSRSYAPTGTCGATTNGHYTSTASGR